MITTRNQIAVLLPQRFKALYQSRLQILVVSLRGEVQRAIDRGTAWLLANQNSNGWWTTPDHPAVTALPLVALNGEPSGKFLKQHTPAMIRGYAFLIGCALWAAAHSLRGPPEQSHSSQQSHPAV